jgi:hypothetical protein
MKNKEELKQSPMLYLSAGSKELFHSNFLYWIGKTNRDLFERIINELDGKKMEWPKNWEIRREYKNTDICIVYNKETGKMVKNHPVTKEYAFLVLENKVKSLATRKQLLEYEEKFDGLFENDCHRYILLSLAKDYAELSDIKNTRWQITHYDKLSQAITEYAKQYAKDEELVYINDYCKYITNLSELVESWKINENTMHPQEHNDLKEMRINDLYEKLYYSKMAQMLVAKLKDEVSSLGICCGISNFENITSREYGILQHIFISSTLSHAIGLLDVKIKVASDTCFVIQLQGNRYCHGIEKKGIYNEINKNNTLAEISFLNFPENRVYNKKICHYGNDFVYNYQKVQNETIGGLLNKIKDDIIEVLGTAMKETKNP